MGIGGIVFAEACRLIVEKWGFFGNLLLQHLEISAIAIIYATIIGLVMGTLIAEHKGASKPVLVIVNLLYTIPSLALLGLLVPFTGVGNTTAIIALTVYGLLPMVKNTYTGVDNVDSRIVEAATGMGSTKAQTLFRIKLPLAAPFIITGFRSMVTMTISVTTIASFIGAGGLGVAIYRGISTNNMPMVLAGSILVAALAIVVDLILGAIERRAFQHTGEKRRRNAKRTAAVWCTAAVVVVLVCMGVYQSNAAKNAEDSGKVGTVNVASKSFTEQLLMGQIVAQYIDDTTDLSVNLTENIQGGTSIIHPAILQGEYDLYPEYTENAWINVLHNDGVYQETQRDQLVSQYEDMDLEWPTFFGFDDTYSIAVRKDIAQQYNLHTFSDLVGVADKLSLGAEYQFYDRPDGYYAMCDYYGFEFGSTQDIDTGLKYRAINSGQVDAIIVYTTDGQLAASDTVMLEDDRGFFPSYNAGVVARKDTLEKYPELREALGKLNDTLDEETITRLNDEVDEDGRDPEDVAHDFLVSSGLVKED